MWLSQTADLRESCPGFNLTHELKNADFRELLRSGALGGKRFDDIADSLTTNRFGTADGYMTVADFESYCQAQQKVGAVWRDARKFGNMSLVNIAKAGIFSSDRAIKQYAEEIWNLD